MLYPNDDTDAGKRLRLKQQYFFSSASLQDKMCIRDSAITALTTAGYNASADKAIPVFGVDATDACLLYTSRCV